MISIKAETEIDGKTVTRAVIITEPVPDLDLNLITERCHDLAEVIAIAVAIELGIINVDDLGTIEEWPGAGF